MIESSEARKRERGRFHVVVVLSDRVAADAAVRIAAVQFPRRRAEPAPHDLLQRAVGIVPQLEPLPSGGGAAAVVAASSLDHRKDLPIFESADFDLFHDDGADWK